MWICSCFSTNPSHHSRPSIFLEIVVIGTRVYHRADCAHCMEQEGLTEPLGSQQAQVQAALSYCQGPAPDCPGALQALIIVRHSNHEDRISFPIAI